jgi:hypothetical protein
MLPIQDSRISFKDGRYIAACACGYVSSFSTKHACLRMLMRGACRHCKKDYRLVRTDVPIYLNADNKWCSRCSGCGKEQAYTRKDHAKQSELADWQCKACVAAMKGFGNNAPIGNVQRLYNKFRKSANSRKIPWNLTIDDFQQAYTGTCALTGWDLDMAYSKCTASLDRIDSTKPYSPDNIQWVHRTVNMCKNKYSQDEFIALCKAVANKVKW